MYSFVSFFAASDENGRYYFRGTDAYQFTRWRIVEPILCLMYKVGVIKTKPLSMYSSDELVG